MTIDEYFSTDKSTDINIINGKNIHFIGVCGTAMGQLAVLLKKNGYNITGSDREFFDPIASLLKEAEINVSQWSSKSTIPVDCDLVVIGNVAGASHPEVQDIKKRNLPFAIFPQIIKSLLVENRIPIVVTGTHGKSTTTSMIAVALSNLGVDPGYFIGAKVVGLNTSLNIGKGTYTVIEGDEYDSAFFAKFPKFHFFNPDTLIVTSLEFDHADIYKSLEDIKIQFNSLMASRKSNHTIIVCTDFEHIREELPKWKSLTGAKFLTYGFKKGISGFVHNLIKSQKKEGQSGEYFSINYLEKNTISIKVDFIGSHNVLNYTAAFIALRNAGFNESSTIDSLNSFQGVARRLEKIVDTGKITIFEDFAHHPTAVKATINALKNTYPKRKIVAVLDPRSNTSRRRVFQSDYVTALSNADSIIIKDVSLRHNDNPNDILDTVGICVALQRRGKNAENFSDIDAIEQKICTAREGSVVVIMSNGAFGGLKERVLSSLA